jgi:predicted Ser/Thr protein kinase
VYRVTLSEQDRIGIGTFQPKDEKNQDSTELTGDLKYRKIAEYGSDSDARAFNFDGESNIANRGMVEFIEVLMLDVRVPLRSARRVAGAQNQAQEIRPDRHRRGYSRPH